ncbi:hypothetical protein BDV09DRAFT_23457 [Aspergillus tetrazonus]
MKRRRPSKVVLRQNWHPHLAYRLARTEPALSMVVKGCWATRQGLCLFVLMPEHPCQTLMTCEGASSLSEISLGKLPEKCRIVRNSISKRE